MIDEVVFKQSVLEDLLGHYEFTEEQANDFVAEENLNYILDCMWDEYSSALQYLVDNR